MRALGIQSWAHSDDLIYNGQYGPQPAEHIQDEGIDISDHLQPESDGTAD